MNKAELIELLLPAILASGKSEPEAREMLERCSTSELGLMKDRQIRAGIYRPLQPQPPRPSVTAADVEKARAEHQREIAAIKQRAADSIVRIEVERALQYEEFVSAKEKAEAPQRKAEAAAREARAREIFPVVCRQHNLSECEANFRVLFSANVLDSTHSAAQYIVSNGGLAPASPTELAQFEAERVERHNQALLSASPSELREAVRQESKTRRVNSVAEATAEADRARQQREAQRGYPPLPEITREALKKASPERLKDWIRKFGSDALTKRLREVA